MEAVAIRILTDMHTQKGTRSERSLGDDKIHAVIFINDLKYNDSILKGRSKLKRPIQAVSCMTYMNKTIGTIWSSALELLVNENNVAYVLWRPQNLFWISVQMSPQKRQQCEFWLLLFVAWRNWMRANWSDRSDPILEWCQCDMNKSPAS